MISGDGRRQRIGFRTRVSLPKAVRNIASVTEDGSVSTSIGSSMNMRGMVLALDRKKAD